MKRILILAALVSTSVFADKTNQYDYAYGPEGIVSGVAGFALARTFNAEDIAGLESVDDICVGNGRIYIADSVSSWIYVLDARDYSLITSIKLIRDENNRIVVIPGTSEQLMLRRPEGVFLSEDLNELYIADTGSERIIVVNSDTYTLKRVITRPDNMAGITNFKPSKIAVDSSGRIYFVVPGSYEGIVELNPDGQFSRFYGVNKPEINPLDYFWKSIATKSQKSKMAKTFAPSFSNLDIDNEGFVYAVTYDAASAKKIFRFNAKGENVIREEGYIKLRGDLTRFYVNKNVASAFTGISSTSFGVYAVVDKNYGRVFVYDFDGYMLTVFSKLGYMKGDLRDPSDIVWNGYDILVGDKTLGAFHVYTPTDFGKAALQATEKYYYGDWEEATAYFEKAIRLNANFYSGYSGIGRSFYMKRNYRQAMYYFKKASDSNMYSQAFNGYRGLWIQKHFVWFIIVVLAAVVAVIYSELRYLRKNSDISGGTL
jgi:tetratricopeptide (TPR) repeat protein